MNQDLVDFGGRRDPILGGMLEPNSSTSSLSIYKATEHNKEIEISILRFKHDKIKMVQHP